MTPGTLIKTYREKRNMTQKQVADALSYTNYQFISLMENGHSPVPRENARLFCRLLKIDTLDMFEAYLNVERKRLKAAGLK